MARETRLLRVQLVLLMVGLALASGLLYIISLDSAASYPEAAHLRVPIFVAVLLGLAPMIAAVKVVFDLLTVIDKGEAFSDQTIRLLRRLKVLLAITAVYLLLGLVGVSAATRAATGQVLPSSLPVWFAAELVDLFLYTLIALFERLFTAAIELRQDNELTV